MSLEKILNNEFLHELIGAEKLGVVKYLKNTGWIILSRILNVAISLFVSLYVIRYLGPTNYGTLSYAISFMSLFTFIAGFGVDSIVYRELIKNPEKEPEILGSAFVIKLLTGILAVATTVLTALLIGVTQLELLIITLVSLPMIGASAHVVAHSYYARVQSKHPSLVILVTNIILSLCKLLVVYFDKGIIYFALIILLESILYTIFYLYFYQKHFSLLGKWRLNKETTMILITGGLPLAASAISITLYSRIDQVMIKHLIDNTAVGLYDAAVRLSDVWYLLPNILITSLFPAIINSKKVSRELFVKRIKMFALLLVTLNLLIILPTFILAPYIINILFGEAFAASSNVLLVYIWSLIGFSLGQLAYTYLLAEDLLYIYFVTSIVSVFINIGLNLVLIPTYGIVGAALATLISYSLIPIIPFGFKKIRAQLFQIY